MTEVEKLARLVRFIINTFIFTFVAILTGAFVLGFITAAAP